MAIFIFIFKYKSIKCYMENYAIKIKSNKIDDSLSDLLAFLEAMRTIEEDEKCALSVINKLAKKEFYLALCYLGACHIWGQYGIEKNLKLGVELIEKGFKNAKKIELKFPENDPYYNYVIGSAYLEGDVHLPFDTQKGIAYLEKAAALKSNEACYCLARSYLWGYNNVRRDVAKGLEYATQAADRGYLWAQHTIGILYLDYNLEIQEDVGKAIKYLNLASKNTNIETEQDRGINSGAKYILGRIYFYGIGNTKIDLKKACDLMQEAAHLGDLEACHFLGARYVYGIDGFVKDPIKAEKYLNIAANKGFPDSQFLLGLNYVLGVQLQRNTDRGLELLHKAAEQGNRNAHSFLGEVYIAGNSFNVVQNVSNGIKHLEIAASNGCPKAQFQLSLIYWKGIIIKRNSKKAIEYLEKSAAQGNKKAIEMLKILILD